MARRDVSSLAELARTSHIRRDTLYGWFRQPVAHVSAQSVEKLSAALGTEPGDPWYQEPIEHHLDAETVALVDAAVARAMDRLADRLERFLDRRLDSGPQDDA
jgi:uncharacterized protein with von Willebrand factor type A (vWA) domain